MTDSTHSIFKSASRFFSGTLLSRITGLARDIAMAFAFGTGAHVAAFLVAFRFAHLLRRLFGEGALQSAFVPLFETLRQNDPKRANRFFLHLKLAVTIILTLIIVFGMIGLGSYLIWDSQEEIVTLTLIMLPSLLFICLYGLNSSLLQCHQHYFVPAVSPAIFNIVWILGILGLMHLPENVAMLYLAGCIILASLCQWLFTLPKTYNILKKDGFDQAKEISPDLWKIGAPMFLGIIGVAAAQINNFLDALFARYASLEGPAFLWYSVRLQQLPLALFGIALSGAVLPPLSRAFKAGQLEQYRHFILYALKYTCALLIPFSFAMLALGTTGITLVYGHGDFGPSSITGTVYCLWGYALGLFPMGLVQILAPAYYARGNYRVPTQASVCAMVLNIILNAWFVFVLGFGAMSIALATSLAAWVNAIILFIGLLMREAIQPFFTSFIISLIGSLIGTTLVFLFQQDFSNNVFNFLAQAALFSLGTSAFLFLFRKRLF